MVFCVYSRYTLLQIKNICSSTKIDKFNNSSDISLKNSNFQQIIDQSVTSYWEKEKFV